MKGIISTADIIEMFLSAVIVYSICHYKPFLPAEELLPVYFTAIYISIDLFRLLIVRKAFPRKKKKRIKPINKIVKQDKEVTNINLNLIETYPSLKVVIDNASLIERVCLAGQADQNEKGTQSGYSPKEVLLARQLTDVAYKYKEEIFENPKTITRECLFKAILKTLK